MIDLTFHQESGTRNETRTIYFITVRLDKATMIDCLKSDKIFINGLYFKVPEEQILKLLLKKEYGETRLELEPLT